MYYHHKVHSEETEISLRMVDGWCKVIFRFNSAAEGISSVNKSRDYLPLAVIIAQR